MYCSHCGIKIEDNATICPHCQSEQNPMKQIHEPTGKPVGLIFKINLIGTTCKTDRISLALSE